MNEQGCEQSTLSPAVSHANLSPLPGSVKAKEMTVISGRKCAASYGKSGPLGCLVKMCLESSIWHSTRCFLTWKTTVTKGNRLLFRLAVSMPHTRERVAIVAHSIDRSGPLRGNREFSDAETDGREGPDYGGGTQEPFAGQRREDESGTAGMADGLRARIHETDAHTDSNGLEGREPGTLLGGWEISSPSARISGTHPAWENWPDGSGIPRISDGISNRVDRIKALGNAVVPQQFYIFFKLMADIEKGAKQ